MDISERSRRWRLLLGSDAQSATGQELCGGDTVIDETMSALYDSSGRFSYDPTRSQADEKMPDTAKWMTDIRSVFPKEILNIIQDDAIIRRDMETMLFEPEALQAVETDVQFAKLLLKMKGKVPEKSKEIARKLIEDVVSEILRRMEPELRSAVTNAVKRRAHSPIPSASAIDWHTTIRKNLGRYDAERRVLLPERFSFFERGQKRTPYRLIVMIDRSASMTGSAIYAAVAGSILLTIPAIQTRVIVFGTSTADMTESCKEPVEFLMSLRFDGGTDIGGALAYCAGEFDDPNRTAMLLISDLFDGASEDNLLKQAKGILHQGVKLVCLTAISETGRAHFDEAMAIKLASAGAHCVTATPESLPTVLEQVLSGAV